MLVICFGLNSNAGTGEMAQSRARRRQCYPAHGADAEPPLLRAGREDVGLLAHISLSVVGNSLGGYR